MLVIWCVVEGGFLKTVEILYVRALSKLLPRSIMWIALRVIARGVGTTHQGTKQRKPLNLPAPLFVRTPFVEGQDESPSQLELTTHPNSLLTLSPVDKIWTCKLFDQGPWSLVVAVMGTRSVTQVRKMVIYLRCSCLKSIRSQTLGNWSNKMQHSFIEASVPLQPFFIAPI